MAAEESTMEYRFLGHSGIKVSNICLGTMTFGPERPIPGFGCDESLCHEMMDRYVALGGNFIDTANNYGKGESEEIVGRWIEKRDRENMVIATKARFPMWTEKNVNAVGSSRRHLTDSIDKSLKRLHTDYVDLYQNHVWDEGTRVEETLRTLDDLVRCGKVRYVGVSNMTGWQLQKVVDTSTSLGLNPLVTLQQEYNLLSRWSEIESFQVCKQEGMGVLPWGPLKGGLLTDKVQRNIAPTDGRLAWAAQDEKTRASPIAPGWSTIDDKTFKILETVQRIGKEKSRSAAQVAIRWLLQKDVVSSVIIGATKMSQLEDNMKAATGWTLSQQQMQQLDDVSSNELPYPYQFILDSNMDRKNPFSPSQHVKTTLL